MLRKAGEGRQLDFADFTRAARAVPRDHELLRIRALQTDAEIDRIFADAYDPAVGRPCCPPSQLFRICVLQFLFNLGDDRAVQEVGFNLLYREFVGLGWNDRVPDASVLSRFRARLLRRVALEGNGRSPDRSLARAAVEGGALALQPPA